MEFVKFESNHIFSPVQIHRMAPHYHKIVYKHLNMCCSIQWPLAKYDYLNYIKASFYRLITSTLLLGGFTGHGITVSLISSSS